MSFDERLQRLTERHEALTQSVELMQATVQDLVRIASVSLDSVKRLERIALSHEARIEGIQERLDRLEGHQT